MKKGKKILTGILGILAVLVLGAIIILGSIFLKKRRQDMRKHRLAGICRKKLRQILQLQRLLL